MAVNGAGPRAQHPRAGRRYVIVSGDSHAGPELGAYRQYCPRQHLEAFDDHVAEVDAQRQAEGGDQPNWLTRTDTNAYSSAARDDALTTMQRIWSNLGSYEPGARLADMDDQGISAEVIFHGAMNGYLVPFGLGNISHDSPRQRELRTVGVHLWNQWLADFCSAAPERLLGVAQVPMWDVEAAMQEVRFAKEHGLRAINFPAPRPDYPPYNRFEVYEPFWSLIDEVDLPLITHSGAADLSSGDQDRGGLMLWLSEVMWFSRRAFGQLVFGGVFDRHPRLTLMFAEQRAEWVAEALRQLDGIYYGVPVNAAMPLLGSRVEAPERSPSEYWRSNCVTAASFMARFEAEGRDEIGIQTLMWGSDYPHVEGTWPRTELALRNTFAGIPEDDVRVMLGDNGMRALRLDPSVIEPVADRIGPTPEAIDRPVSSDEYPPFRGYAFRESSAFH